MRNTCIKPHSIVRSAPTALPSGSYPLRRPNALADVACVGNPLEHLDFNVRGLANFKHVWWFPQALHDSRSTKTGGSDPEPGGI